MVYKSIGGYICISGGIYIYVYACMWMCRSEFVYMWAYGYGYICAYVYVQMFGKENESRKSMGERSKVRRERNGKRSNVQ